MLVLNSGCYRTDSGISKGIEVQGHNFSYEGNCEKGTTVYREISNVVQVQEKNLYDRCFDDSKASLSSETWNQNLNNLSQAHVLDPYTISEFL
jgi:hypothetical protein